MVSKGLGYLRSNALGALALFVALGGTGYAATGGFTSGGQLQACVREDGSLTLLKAGKHCKRSQTKVAWNQTGPAGPKGTTGSSGATGATGAAGAAGAAGQPASAEWATVEGNGKLIAGHGVVSTKLTFGPSFEVIFDRDMSRCGVTATSNQTALTMLGYVDSEHPNTVFVLEEASPGVQAANAFTVAAFC